MTDHTPATTASPVQAHPSLLRLPVTLRPARSLMTYYALTSLLAGPGFPILLLVLYFRYHTMRYVVEEEGITMRWGILFRREVSLTYARIQDIHLVSNLFERWLGLARIQVQTASGSASAEMTIEGLPQFEAIRDFLYSKMRGSRDLAGLRSASAAERALPAGGLEELTGLLREITAEVRAIRHALPARAGEEKRDV